ncbi:MAG: 2-oxoacid:acceptor oxidoreductase family protein [Verrucomicrobiota bacterium]|nr:2-oxoacid:acceptor oxidoreductase family protein [Verrucomicrobiota bacterium]
MSILKTQGLYERFTRKGPTNQRATHYCAGCGHGIVHKLIGEALAELGIQERTIFISPVGCSVFCYYYMNAGNVQVAHGRAPAVGTGLARTLEKKVVISYQGDGDLAAIGFNATFQAANRGESIAVFFINNAIYGMTGGQMAPTTLVGQRTATSPGGRDPLTMGYPIHVCEVLNQLYAPVYIERVSVADTPRIMKARRAIRKALEIQKDSKGYAFVEILSPCPTNFKGTTLEAAQFCINEMEKEYPLSCLRDRTAEVSPKPEMPARILAHDFFPLLPEANMVTEADDKAINTRQFKVSGFGGQGVLSLRQVSARAAQTAGLHVSWLPAYGPEQRGGSAACSVIISGKHIGSPAVVSPDIFVAMNQPSYERFGPVVVENGVILYDSHIPIEKVPIKKGVRIVGVPAIEMARQMGVPKAANTALLGAMAALDLIPLPLEVLLDALDKSFKSKQAVAEKNRLVFDAACRWVKEQVK